MVTPQASLGSAKQTCACCALPSVSASPSTAGMQATDAVLQQVSNRGRLSSPLIHSAKLQRLSRTGLRHGDQLRAPPYRRCKPIYINFCKTMNALSA